MEIQYYNKNDMKIIVKANKSSILSDLLSWNTSYLFNDIFILNYEKSEIKMQIYFQVFLRLDIPWECYLL